VIFYDRFFRNGIARINTDGSLDFSFDPSEKQVDYNVNAIVIQPDGKIIIGGTIHHFFGIVRNNITRLNKDGSLDLSFQQLNGADREINSIVQQPDGKILIGGYFKTYNGIVRNGVARLNANGTLDNSFDPDIEENYFEKCLALQPDGKVVVGGSGGLTRLNSDGTFDTTLKRQNNLGWVYQILLQPDRKILATVSDGVTRLNEDGIFDTSFSSSTRTGVEAVALQRDGKILIGGLFGFYNQCQDFS
jgi:uncharacterized delta-60 repeat protein